MPHGKQASRPFRLTSKRSKFWQMGSRGRRHGIPGRPGAHNGRRSHRQTAARHALHSHHTNLKIYWDRIRIDNSPADLPFRTTEIPLGHGARCNSGATRAWSRDTRRTISPTSTRTSASPALTRARPAITRATATSPNSSAHPTTSTLFSAPAMKSRVDFDATHMPDLRPGWTRDYFFYADGFAKDMDFYAAHGDTVSPMPFHTLIPYPYPAGTAYPAGRPLICNMKWNTIRAALPGRRVQPIVSTYPDPPPRQ